MTEQYDDIIHLPRHVSPNRPHMAIINRAAQFAPFAALTGYDAAVRETARLTDQRIELDEPMQAALSDRLQIMAERIGEKPEVAITYFQSDTRKSGGTYVTVAGMIKKIDEFERVVHMTDGTAISIEEIVDIDGRIFEAMFDEPSTAKE